MLDLLVEGGHVVDPSQGIDREATILVKSGKIAAINPSVDQIPSNVNRLDARDRIVAPGFVDLGTELREPGREEDETISTGVRAALSGGYTSILCAANTEPPIDSPAAVELVRQKAARADGARVYVTGCVSKGRAGEQMAELGLLVEAGAVAFSDSPRPIADAGLLRRSLQYAGMFDKPIFDRPEVPELTVGGVMHEGCVSLVLGLTGIPTEAEDLAIARDVRLIEATGGRLHIGPVSTMGAIDLLRRAKARKIPVTASVCPYNLTLDDSLLRTFDSSLKVQPPLRSLRHVRALQEALIDGTIDAICSGHSPRALEKKMEEIDKAPFGMISLETCMAQVVTALVATSRMSWSLLVERMSTTPARIAGIPGGTLHVGALADLVVIDPRANWTVRREDLLSKCHNTPLLGQPLIGRVTHTIVEGVVKFSR